MDQPSDHQHGQDHDEQDNDPPGHDQIREEGTDQVIDSGDGLEKVLLVGAGHDHPIVGFKVEDGGDLFPGPGVAGVLPHVFVIKGLPLRLAEGLGHDRLDHGITLGIFLVPDTLAVPGAILGDDVLATMVSLAADDADIPRFPYLDALDGLSQGGDGFEFFTHGEHPDDPPRFVRDGFVGREVPGVHAKGEAPVRLALQDGRHDRIGRAVGQEGRDIGPDGPALVQVFQGGGHPEHIAPFAHPLKDRAGPPDLPLHLVHDQHRRRRTPVLAQPYAADGDLG